MKIIGDTGSGFILQASKDEVFNLIGYYSQYSSNAPTLPVGCNICVSEMYKQLYRLTEAYKAMADISSKLYAADKPIADVVIPIKIELK